MLMKECMNFKKIVKFFKEWKWALILISICIAGIPLTFIYGIESVKWGNDFWPNALSEFLGMFVDLLFSALFTFVVIDKYMQYHKNLQWKRIKKITYKNLYFILSNILLQLNSSFPKEMSVESYILTEDTDTLNDYLPKEDFDNFVSSLINTINTIIEQKHSGVPLPPDSSDSFADEKIYASLAKFKYHSKAEINSLSSLIVPKLLSFSDDLTLLDNVIEFEELFTSLMSKISTIHRKNSNESKDVKYIWLLKIQEIVNRIKAIADSIYNDIDTD